MALIKCEECGKEVSDKASTCQNCGCPNIKFKKNKKINVKIIVIINVIVIITLLFIIIIINNRKPKLGKYYGTTPALTHEQIELLEHKTCHWSEYNANLIWEYENGDVVISLTRDPNNHLAICKYHNKKLDCEYSPAGYLKVWNVTYEMKD